MADLVDLAVAQCRLDFVTTTQLKLSRLDGYSMPLKIGGVWSAKTIPSGGATVSNSGLAANTKHYVYAFDSAGTLTLEVVTTAYAIDSATGIKVKNGDDTRTLVGLAVTGAGSPGVFKAQGLGTLSYHNRRRQISRIDTAAYFSGNNASYTEVDSSLRVTFVNWADDTPICWYNTSGGVNAGADQWLAIYLDGSTFKVEQYGGTGGTVFMRTGLHASLTGVTDEASHFVTLMRKESATQFIGGNQTTNKMNTVAEVCVWG